MDKERYGMTSRLPILTGNYLYLDGKAQAGNFWTGNNSNDPDADRLTGQDQHRNEHLGIIYVLALLLAPLYSCPCVIFGQLLE